VHVRGRIQALARERGRALTACSLAAPPASSARSRSRGPARRHAAQHDARRSIVRGSPAAQRTQATARAIDQESAPAAASGSRRGAGERGSVIERSTSPAPRLSGKDEEELAGRHVAGPGRAAISIEASSATSSGVVGSRIGEAGVAADRPADANLAIDRARRDLADRRLRHAQRRRSLELQIGGRGADPADPSLAPL